MGEDTPNPRIFVSYSHADAYFVLGGLVPHLETVFGQSRIWVDRELNRDLGKDWNALIHERVNWCDIFIYCLSNDSIDSVYCKDEYQTARSSAKPIPVIPVIVRPRTDPKDWLKLQLVDFSKGLERGGIDEQAMQTLIDGVVSLFSQVKSGTYLPDSSLPDLSIDPVDLLTIRANMLSNIVENCRNGIITFREYSRTDRFQSMLSQLELEYNEWNPSTGGRPDKQHKLPGEVDLLVGILASTQDEDIASNAVGALIETDVFKYVIGLDWIEFILHITSTRFPTAYTAILESLNFNITEANRRSYSPILDSLVARGLLEPTDAIVAQILEFVETGKPSTSYEDEDQDSEFHNEVSSSLT